MNEPRDRFLLTLPWSRDGYTPQETPDYEGCGVPQEHRPFTLSNAAALIARAQSFMGGIPPSSWHISEEQGNELRLDVGDYWVGYPGSPHEVLHVQIFVDAAESNHGTFTDE